MLRAGSGALRVLRALVFLAAVTSLTVGAHVLAGGSVSTLAVVCLAALSWPVAIVGSRRQRRVRSLFPALLVGQAAGHGVLAFLGSAGSGAAAVATGCSTSALHRGHQMLECGEPSSMVMPGGAHGLAMTGAHVLAALVLAAALAWGEALLWRVVDLVVLALPSVGALPVGFARASFVVRLRPSSELACAVRGRGPPVPA